MSPLDIDDLLTEAAGLMRSRIEAEVADSLESGDFSQFVFEDQVETAMVKIAVCAFGNPDGVDGLRAALEKAVAKTRAEFA